MRRFVLGAAVLALAACGGTAVSSSMLVRLRPRPLALTGADSIALPPPLRDRYGVVVGTLSADGTKYPCLGEVWLRRPGDPVTRLQAVGPGDNWGMFRFGELPPGEYEVGARCLGYAPVRRKVKLGVGDILRVLIDMQPMPIMKDSIPPAPRILWPPPEERDVFQV